MPSNIVYRCSQCGTEYRPLDAGARRYLCCGRALERGQVKRCHPKPIPPPVSPSGVASATAASASLEVIEVIPPRENTVDVLAVETMLNSLSTGSLFALEIAGDAAGRRFLLRGPSETLAPICRQIQATYDQVSFRKLTPEQDPARPSQLSCVSAHLRLRRPAYLPIRTFENGDLAEADPVRGLLGAFDGFEADECAVAQIILLPAPPRWAARYEGSTRRVEKSMAGEPMTFGASIRQFVSVLGFMTAVGFGVWALLAFMQHAWLTFALASALCTGAVGGVISLYSLFNEQANVDPDLIKAKVATPAYDVSMRLFVVAKTPARVQAKLQELIAAYSRVNLQSGNSVVPEIVEFDPQVLVLDRAPFWKELTAHVMRLNVSELASLWHLPVGPNVPLVNRNLTRRILPMPEQVNEGVLVGHSNSAGKSIPVHLPLSTLAHHSFMVAKTQKGKSTLMAHLARAVMENDTSVIVVDPHGDLARSLLSLVPRRRADDVLYIDFSDTQQFVGLNLLDVNQGRSADAIVSNIVHVGELIWSDNWGPRMEDALRMALRTLLTANKTLAAQNRPQFTLLDIPALFELPTFRHRLWGTYVKDVDILQWWGGYFDGLYDNLRLDIVNPVLTKIHRFSTHSVVRNIVGQSASTVNFRELLDRRRILLVNTATGVIGPDAGGLLGAVLVDYINFSVREQMAIPDPAARGKVVIVVDEFQSIPGVDYPGLLAELQKMGASFILATQALGQLDAISEELRPAILSNVETLFVFQTSADDADVLRHELDDEVSGTDIINLSDHSCYIKTQSGRDRLPVMHVETLPPHAGDPSVAEQVVGQMTRYTRSGRIVEAERDAFKQQWYGRELNMLRHNTKLQSEAAGGDDSKKNKKPNQPASKSDATEPDDQGNAHGAGPTQASSRDARILRDANSSNDASTRSDKRGEPNLESRDRDMGATPPRQADTEQQKTIPNNRPTASAPNDDPTSRTNDDAASSNTDDDASKPKPDPKRLNP